MARLSIVGALDPDDLVQFEGGRLEFGAEAEAVLDECRKLNAVFALSLHPCEPDPRTKARLFKQIMRSSLLSRVVRNRRERGELLVSKAAQELN